jgi:hypothetical protein
VDKRTRGHASAFTPEPRSGTRIADAEISRILDSIKLTMEIVRSLPTSMEATALMDSAAALDAMVRTWVEHRPTEKEQAATKREVLALKDATTNLRERVNDVRRVVLSLLERRETLTILEISVLLRYHGHAAAGWDVSHLRTVLVMEPRLRVVGHTVRIAS